MTKWHERVAANIGLRTGGAALLGLGGATAVRLHHIALGVAAREPTSLMMLLAAVIVLCGSAGSGLFFVGPGLWETVEVSERWRRLPAPDFAAEAEPSRKL
jgi:hypothetical protein